MDAPPVIKSTPRRQLWQWWMVVLPVIAVALVLFEFNPSRYGFYPRCLLYVTTGIYCPGCGATRAAYELMHGHLVTAMRDNLLLVLALPCFAAFGLRWLWCWQTGAPLPRCTLTLRWIVAVAALLLVYTFLRNIHSEPFTWLAPIG